MLSTGYLNAILLCPHTKWRVVTSQASLAIVNTDFYSSSLSLFSHHSLLFTHIGDIQEADFFWVLTQLEGTCNIFLFIFLFYKSWFFGVFFCFLSQQSEAWANLSTWSIIKFHHFPIFTQPQIVSLQRARNGKKKNVCVYSPCLCSSNIPGL